MSRISDHYSQDVGYIGKTHETQATAYDHHCPQMFYEGNNAYAKSCIARLTAHKVDKKCRKCPEGNALMKARGLQITPEPQKVKEKIRISEMTPEEAERHREMGRRQKARYKLKKMLLEIENEIAEIELAKNNKRVAAILETLYVRRDRVRAKLAGSVGGASTSRLIV